MLYLTFPLLSLLAGMVLGQRFRVLVLVPAMAVVLPIAIGAAAASHQGLGTIVLLGTLSVASLQIGYLLGVGIRHALAGARISGLRSRAVSGLNPVRRAAH
jgi:hypothetical protein